MIDITIPIFTVKRKARFKKRIKKEKHSVWKC